MNDSIKILLKSEAYPIGDVLDNMLCQPVCKNED